MNKIFGAVGKLFNIYTVCHIDDSEEKLTISLRTRSVCLEAWNFFLFGWKKLNKYETRSYSPYEFWLDKFDGILRSILSHHDFSETVREFSQELTR